MKKVGSKYHRLWRRQEAAPDYHQGLRNNQPRRIPSELEIPELDLRQWIDSQFNKLKT